MKPRPVQYFTPEYLELCKQMTPGQILEFIDNFQKLLSFQVQTDQRKVKKPKN